ncbi:MAG: serine protease, partial [Methyloversatilis sp.]|nr:serine protease [Methyloversatilis sp.]
HENDGDWGRLQAVAKEWVEAEPNNSAAIKAAVRASQLPPLR